MRKRANCSDNVQERERERDAKSSVSERATQTRETTTKGAIKPKSGWEGERERNVDE